MSPITHEVREAESVLLALIQKERFRQYVGTAPEPDHFECIGFDI